MGRSQAVIETFIWPKSNFPWRQCYNLSSNNNWQDHWILLRTSTDCQWTTVTQKCVTLEMLLMIRTEIRLSSCGYWHKSQLVTALWSHNSQSSRALELQTLLWIQQIDFNWFNVREKVWMRHESKCMQTLQHYWQFVSPVSATCNVINLSANESERNTNT